MTFSSPGQYGFLSLLLRKKLAGKETFPTGLDQFPTGAALNISRLSHEKNSGEDKRVPQCVTKRELLIVTIGRLAANVWM
jgi:hypothetical protein